MAVTEKKERKTGITVKPTFGDRAKKVVAVTAAVAASPIPVANVIVGVIAGRVCKGVDDELEIAEADAQHEAEAQKVIADAKAVQATETQATESSSQPETAEATR